MRERGPIMEWKCRVNIHQICLFNISDPTGPNLCNWVRTYGHLVNTRSKCDPCNAIQGAISRLATDQQRGYRWFKGERHLRFAHSRLHLVNATHHAPGPSETPQWTDPHNFNQSVKSRNINQYQYQSKYNQSIPIFFLMESASWFRTAEAIFEEKGKVNTMFSIENSIFASRSLQSLFASSCFSKARNMSPLTLEESIDS